MHYNINYHLLLLLYYTDRYLGYYVLRSIYCFRFLFLQFLFLRSIYCFRFLFLQFLFLGSIYCFRFCFCSSYFSGVFIALGFVFAVLILLWQAYFAYFGSLLFFLVYFDLLLTIFAVVIYSSTPVRKR